MQATYQVFCLRLCHKEADIPLRRALADHAQINIGESAKHLAGDFGLAAYLFPDEADQGFAAFPTHMREALQFLSNGSQRLRGVDQQREAPARGRQQIEAVLVTLEHIENFTQQFRSEPPYRLHVDHGDTLFGSDGLHYALISGMGDNLGTLTFWMARIQNGNRN